MALLIREEDVSAILTPQLGSLLLSRTPLCAQVRELLASYTPSRQTLPELHDALENLLIVRIHTATRGRFMAQMPDGTQQSITHELLDRCVDELMEPAMRSMKPSPTAFLSLNEYSMHTQSLSALRTLYEGYRSFFSEEEYRFLIHMIRSLYPPEKTSGWLREDEAE